MESLVIWLARTRCLSMDESWRGAEHTFESPSNCRSFFELNLTEMPSRAIRNEPDRGRSLNYRGSRLWLSGESLSIPTILHQVPSFVSLSLTRSPSTHNAWLGLGRTYSDRGRVTCSNHQESYSAQSHGGLRCRKLSSMTCWSWRAGRAVTIWLGIWHDPGFTRQWLNAVG
jgi:hypothetical protein